MLSTSSRRDLRAKAHALKPVVLLGQHGLTPTVIAAIDEALAAHELIKVRLRGIEREDRNSFAAQIAVPLHAEVVNLIGHILTLYREAPPVVVPEPRRPKSTRPPAKKKRTATTRRTSPASDRDYSRKPASRTPNRSPRRGPKDSSRRK